MLKIFDFFINLSRLARPLSNTKNVLIICLAFFLSGAEFNLVSFILGIISLSFFCSAVYIFNTICDAELDKNNKNKEQYYQSVSYFGKRKSIIIFLALVFLGLVFGVFINLYFVFSSLFLLLFGFLYSSPYFRFKERIFLDVLFSSFFTYAFRFIAAWFIFKVSFPPILPVLALAFAKSGGYMLDKGMDRSFLLEKNIKNSVTVISKKTNIIVSTILLSIAVVLASLIYFNVRYFKADFIGYLPENMVFLFPFAVPPLLIMYLKVLNKINTKRRYLRVLGLLYLFLVLGTALMLS